MNNDNTKYTEILIDHHRTWPSYKLIPQKEKFFFCLLYRFPEFTTIELDKLVEIVLESLEILELSHICFDYTNEGIHYRCYARINDLMKILIKRKNFSIDNFVILSGAVECVENHKLYSEYIKKYQWLPVQIFFTDYWELCYSDVIRCFPEVYARFKSQSKIKERFFLNFNRCPRPHRLAFIAFCIENKWLDNSYVSFYHPTYVEEITTLAESDKILLPNLYKKINDILNKSNDIFPLKLNLTKERDNPFDLSQEFDYFDNSYLSIVSETKYFSNSSDEDFNKNDSTLDCFFFTEKIYKAISARHPFILLSTKGALRILRKKGYLTFHPYIDELYDTIDNDEERLLAIVDEIKRIEKFDDTQWLRWQKSIKKIVDHNQSHLISHYNLNYSR
jgi:hypothetical protein